MNVKEFQNPFVFWLPAGTCCRNQAIFIKKLKSGILFVGPPFFKNPLYVSR
jgi:hypothetical protein